MENRAAAVDVSSPSRSLGADVPRRLRSRRTNDPLANIKTNTARGRRLADLVRAYMNALGKPPEIERQAAVIAAAELQVLAEEARAAALAGGANVDLDQLIRLQGAADRAIRRLGIKSGAEANQSNGQAGLAAYLAANYAGRDDDETGEAAVGPQTAPDESDHAAARSSASTENESAPLPESFAGIPGEEGGA